MPARAAAATAAAPAPASGTKRKRLSKNKKKTWRTLSRDVDEILPQETKREVAKRRSGGFFLDVSGADQKRRVGLTDQLRCHSGLLQDNGGPPPHVPKRLQKLDQQRVKRKAKNVKPKATAAAPAAAAAAADKGKASAYDLWDAEIDSKQQKTEAELEQQRLEQQHLQAIGQLPVKRRVRTAKAELPSCLVPPNGASFNPSLEAHQQLLLQVESEESLKEQREAKLRNQLDRHFPTASRQQLQAQELGEMSAGLFEEEEHDEEDEEEKKEAVDVDKQQQQQHISSKNNREAKRQQAAAKERKRQRKMAHDLSQLTGLCRQVTANQAKLSERQAAKLAKRMLAAKSTKRLGRMKFSEVEEQFKLPQELQPSLRQLRPEGDLFVDAVKALQRRNVLEPTQRAKWRPRYKPKRVPKKNRAGQEQQQQQQSTSS